MAFTLAVHTMKHDLIDGFSRVQLPATHFEELLQGRKTHFPVFKVVQRVPFLNKDGSLDRFLRDRLPQSRTKAREKRVLLKEFTLFA